MNTQVRRWWVSLDGKVDGPRSQAYILMGLQSGQLPIGVQVCPEGDTEWKQAVDCPEFVTSSPATSTLPPLPPPQAHYHNTRTNDRLVTNARLPAMANAICIFTVVLLPLYWVLGSIISVATLEESNAGFVEFLYGLLIRGPVSLATTILLVIAGLRLHDLRSSAVRLIKIGFLIDFALVAVSFLVALPIVLFVAANDPAPPAQTTGAAVLLTVIQAFAGFAALAFEIAAFIWLSKNTSRLPLDQSR